MIFGLILKTTEEEMGQMVLFKILEKNQDILMLIFLQKKSALQIINSKDFLSESIEVRKLKIIKNKKVMIKVMIVKNIN